MNKFTKFQRNYLMQMFEDGAAGDGAKDDKGASGTDGKDGQSKGADEKKYSDADLDRIVSQKFAKWQKDQEKAVSEAEKKAKMDAQQKAEYERDQLQKRVDELEANENRSKMATTARYLLNEADISISDDLVDNLLGVDEDSTTENVKQFIKVFNAAVQKQVKEALKGKTPGTGSSGTITKEQIMQIKDRTERQRMIQKHKNLFKY